MTNLLGDIISYEFEILPCKILKIGYMGFGQNSLGQLQMINNPFRLTKCF